MTQQSRARIYRLKILTRAEGNRNFTPRDVIYRHESRTVLLSYNLGISMWHRDGQYYSLQIQGSQWGTGAVLWWGSIFPNPPCQIFMQFSIIQYYKNLQNILNNVLILKIHILRFNLLNVQRDGGWVSLRGINKSHIPAG